MQIDIILKDAVEQKASDIFFVAGSPVAFKINGVIVKQTKYVAEGKEFLDAEACENYISQIYGLAKYSDISTFIKTGDDDFSFSSPGIGRFRVNVYRQRNSQAAVLRVVNFKLPNPVERHIPQSVMDLANTKKGMVLVSGPAGSGKSTTLACIIDQINENRNVHIITIEDPIEYIHSHKQSIVSQREIYHDTQGYLHALRAALRETPEVILLGEMRDKETISTAITAAETGHLLFSTLHTIGSVNTIDRILDSFDTTQEQIRAQLSTVLTAVVSEQLIPKIGGGVIPAFEIMIVNQAIRSQIREGKTHQIQNTMSSNKTGGMQLMDDSIYDLYQQGLITKENAIIYAINHEQMSKKLG